MATGIAGNVAFGAARDLSRGSRPDFRDLLVTPGNARRLANELSNMRGAAMKLGQLLSMDTGEVLSPELADILARLRDNAHFMPPKQLKRVLDANWGENWRRAFESFDVRPMAAASIGQVHKATLRDGRRVAVKVQYPGVARSIDSDVANVGSLVRLSGLVPKGFDLAPYLAEARAQLHEETDYAREGLHLERFGDRLAGNAHFDVPVFHADWSTHEVLTMSFVEGEPIEAAADAPQHVRNEIAARLIHLLLQEVFDFHEVQSDPNFANYRYNARTGRIALLDFGATRRLDPDLVARYRQLFAAGLEDDMAALTDAATAIGFLDTDGLPEHRDRIVGMIAFVFATLRETATFDFARTDLSKRMEAEGTALARSGYIPPPVPMDVLYLQRKFGGVFLLANRLSAQVPVRDLMTTALAMSGSGQAISKAAEC
ncbi:MAG: AarF/ABC1/UbiB kinase family protein [Pseudomonadota bacterium]